MPLNKTLTYLKGELQHGIHLLIAFENETETERKLDIAIEYAEHMKHLMRIHTGAVQQQSFSANKLHTGCAGAYPENVKVSGDLVITPAGKLESGTESDQYNDYAK